MRFEMGVAKATEGCVFEENDLRISVLTSRIVRIEKGSFTDLKTQSVVCRDFDKPQFNIKNTCNKVLVVTKDCVFDIDKNTLKTKVAFSGQPLEVCDDNKDNLGGTARTLDGTFGVLGGWKGKREKRDRFFIEHIRKGIFSRTGVVEFDDSKSFLLQEDGNVCPRTPGAVDKYIFAFGKDFLGGLKQFYSLTGATPVLPKYALGNWWSRYHAYTQDEYLALMDKFESKNIPLTVATIDMDWHIVKNVPKDVKSSSIQGAGWTGYTFEKALFPDYKAFLKNLKARNLAITMNLHPRDGVRYFEEQYEDMAKACGVDPQSKQPVVFDLTNETFRNAYFDILHHPYENDGVDFWWIDWQQGTKSAMKGLDPLWLLNHYHTLDICRDKKGIILSRYSGVGSHRYPLGFSGDTFVCWKSLRFQPYFTALASNVGYSWWSHDIGGHLFGRGDNELYLRWLQFGVFSPINRLHSNNMALSKEPWNYPQVEALAEDFLRMRHRMLPYLYSANVRTAKDGVPLICPLYYYTDDERAYEKAYRNQYFFGEQLLVAPVTTKGKNGVAKLNVFLPEGEWTNIFSKAKFEGGKCYDVECPLDEMLVFAKAGAILPALDDENGNSQEYGKLKADIYLGENEFDLFDETSKMHFSLHKIEDKYALDICVYGECKTSSLKLNFVGVESGNLTLKMEGDLQDNFLCFANENIHIDDQKYGGNCTDNDDTAYGKNVANIHIELSNVL